MKETKGTLIEDSIRTSALSGDVIANYDLEDSHQATAYADSEELLPEQHTFTFENGGWADTFRE